MIPVLVESPFAGDVWNNIEYARACMADCLKRGEAPFASHLLYTQEGVLNDNVPEERELGIEAGLLWGRFAKRTVVYVDRGISRGMRAGIARAITEGRPVEFRSLPAYQTAEALRALADAMRTWANAKAELMAGDVP